MLFLRVFLAMWDDAGFDFWIFLPAKSAELPTIRYIYWQKHWRYARALITSTTCQRSARTTEIICSSKYSFLKEFMWQSLLSPTRLPLVILWPILCIYRPLISRPRRLSDIALSARVYRFIFVFFDYLLHLCTRTFMFICIYVCMYRRLYISYIHIALFIPPPTLLSWISCDFQSQSEDLRRRMSWDSKVVDILCSRRRCCHCCSICICWGANNGENMTNIYVYNVNFLSS